MRLTARVTQLEARAAPARRGRPVPDDPVAFARGLLAGAFSPADLDPAHPHHVGWAARVGAFAGVLGPVHQAWLGAARERNPGAYPGAVLSPVTAEQVVAALDAVMRCG